VRYPDLKLHPVRYIPDRDMEVWLCNCKQTKTRPFCDGSHKELKPVTLEEELFEPGVDVCVVTGTCPFGELWWGTCPFEANGMRLEADPSGFVSSRKSRKNSCQAGSTASGSSRKRWYISSTSHSFGPNWSAWPEVLLLDTLGTALIGSLRRREVYFPG